MFFFSSRRRHTRFTSDWSSDVCSSDLAIAEDGLIWADITSDHSTPTPVAVSAAPTRGDGEAMARTTYTTQHPPVWGSMVSGYLVTKAIAAGVMLMASLLVLMGHGDEQSVVGIVPPLVAGVFLVATGLLLVFDLKQPKIGRASCRERV